MYNSRKCEKYENVKKNGVKWVKWVVCRGLPFGTAFHLSLLVIVILIPFPPHPYPCRIYLLSWNHIPLRGPTKVFFKYYTIFYYYCQIGNPLPSRTAITKAFFKYYIIFFNKSQMRERVLVLWENSHMGRRLLEV